MPPLLGSFGPAWGGGAGRHTLKKEAENITCFPFPIAVPTIPG